MASFNEQALWFKTMLPYAQKASQATDIPVSVILSQWALETGYGTSASARVANNYGGIKPTSNSPYQAGVYLGHAKYPSISAFVDDWIRVMKLSYYNAVRAAGSPEGTIKALDESPYAEDTKYGSKLTSILSSFGLKAYDTGGTYGGMPPISNNNGANNLSQDDLLKYAGIGLAFMAVVSVLRD